jgi:hypothetical protein
MEDLTYPVLSRFRFFSFFFFFPNLFFSLFISLLIIKEKQKVEKLNKQLNFPFMEIEKFDEYYN